MRESKYSKGLEGRRYGRWTVISFSHAKKVGKTYDYFWLCQCLCGTKKNVSARLLARYKTRSCGCYKLEFNARAFTKHGLLSQVRKGGRYPPEYGSWQHMIQRCNQPKHNKWWHRYGGRGITICEGFRNFANFSRLVGHKPTKTHSVDRINNDGHYSCGECQQCRENGWPLNCRWATPKEQAANTCRSPQYRTARVA